MTVTFKVLCLYICKRRDLHHINKAADDIERKCSTREGGGLYSHPHALCFLELKKLEISAAKLSFTPSQKSNLQLSSRQFLFTRSSHKICCLVYPKISWSICFNLHWLLLYSPILKQIVIIPSTQPWTYFTLSAKF